MLAIRSLLLPILFVFLRRYMKPAPVVLILVQLVDPRRDVDGHVRLHLEGRRRVPAAVGVRESSM